MPTQITIGDSASSLLYQKGSIEATNGGWQLPSFPVVDDTVKIHRASHDTAVRRPKVSMWPSNKDIVRIPS